MDRDERVSLNPLDGETALRGLLGVEPERNANDLAKDSLRLYEALSHDPETVALFQSWVDRTARTEPVVDDFTRLGDLRRR